MDFPSIPKREGELTAAELRQKEVEAARQCGCYCCLRKVPSPFHPEEFPRQSAATDLFIVCRQCGNKRCPKATHHSSPCTGSNEPGQHGSRFSPDWKLPYGEPAEPEPFKAADAVLPESPEAKEAKATAKHNLAWLAGVILKAHQGSDGDAATVRILLAKIAGAVGHPELMWLASTALSIAQAEERNPGKPCPVLDIAGAAEKIYGQQVTSAETFN